MYVRRNINIESEIHKWNRRIQKIVIRILVIQSQDITKKKVFMYYLGIFSEVENRFLRVYAP